MNDVKRGGGGGWGEPGGAAVSAADNELRIAKELLRSTDSVVNGIYALTAAYAIATTMWDEAPFKSTTDQEAAAMACVSLFLDAMCFLFVASMAKVMRDGRWNALVIEEKRKVASSAWDFMPVVALVLVAGTVWRLRAAVMWMAAIRKGITVVMLTLAASILTRNREDAAKLA